MTMKVLGLDLSMTTTGICLPDGRTVTVATNAKDKDGRLVMIRNAVMEAVRLDGADLVVMEEAPPGLKGPAIKAIHMVHGAVRTVLLDLGVPYAVVNPSTLKVYATSRKGADKTAMAMAAYKRAGMEFADDNQCDAWWLRAMGLDKFGQETVSVPQAQRAFLDSVAWPVVPDPVTFHEDVDTLFRNLNRPRLTDMLEGSEPGISVEEYREKLEPLAEFAYRPRLTDMLDGSEPGVPVKLSGGGA